MTCLQTTAAQIARLQAIFAIILSAIILMVNTFLIVSQCFQLGTPVYTHALKNICSVETTQADYSFNSFSIHHTVSFIFLYCVTSVNNT